MVGEAIRLADFEFDRFAFQACHKGPIVPLEAEEPDSSSPETRFTNGPAAKMALPIPRKTAIPR